MSRISIPYRLGADPGLALKSRNFVKAMSRVKVDLQRHLLALQSSFQAPASELIPSVPC